MVDLGQVVTVSDLEIARLPAYRATVKVATVQAATGSTLTLFYGHFGSTESVSWRDYYTVSINLLFHP